MADNVVGIDIVARLDAFRAELAKLPDIGAAEAKSLTAALSREIKASEKAAKDAAKASQALTAATKQAGQAAKETARAVRSAEDAFGAAGGGAAKLAGALDLIVPGAGSAARAVADFADVGEVATGAAGALGASGASLLAVLGPLALAAGAVGYATYEYYERQEAVAERSADYVTALSAIRRGYDEITDALDELQLREDVLKGLTSPEEAEALRAQGQAEKVFAAERGRVVDELQKQADRLAALNAMAGENKDSFFGLLGNVVHGDTMAALANETAVVSDRVETLQGKLKDLDQQAGAYGERLGQVTTGERKAVESKREHAEATRRAAEAYRAAEEAARAYGEQLAAEQAAGEASRATYDAAIAKLGELTAADQRAGMSKEEQAAADHAAALQQIEDLHSQALIVAQTETARENAHAEANAAIEAEQTRHYAALDALRQDDLKRERDAAAEKQAALTSAAFSTASAVAGAVQAVADSVVETAQDGTEEQKKLAGVAFRVSQGAAIAQTVVTTAKAAMDAYAAALMLGPAGLVLAPIAAGAAAAAGAAQVAAIAAESPPKFHAGLAPDEVPATITRGEGVLTPRGVAANGGPAGVRAANRGEAPAAQPIVVVQQFQHRVLDAALADSLKMASSPLRRAIRAGRRAGHRRRD